MRVSMVHLFFYLALRRVKIPPRAAPATGPRNSAEPVRRWRYLHRVLPTKRKLKMLVYQLTELSPMRYVDYMYRMY